MQVEAFLQVLKFQQMVALPGHLQRNNNLVIYLDTSTVQAL